MVGHVLLSRLRSPAGALALAPVSVRPDRQGEGIGSALIRAALEQAAAAGCQAVFVLGEPEYYGRFGFLAESAEAFATPYPGPYFMALALEEGALGRMEKTVVYAPAFDAL